MPNLPHRVTTSHKLYDHYDKRDSKAIPIRPANPVAGPPPTLKGKISRAKHDARAHQVADLVLQYEAAVDAESPSEILKVLSAMEDAGLHDLARVKRRDCPIKLGGKQ